MATKTSILLLLWMASHLTRLDKKLHLLKESSKKAPPKKVADWQKQKTDKKDTKELVMVETKTTKATKPKKTTKPKAAPKTKKAKVTSKKD